MSQTTHTPLVDEPFLRPQRWGDEEIERLSAAMRQDSLFYWKGPQTETLYEAFRAHYPLKYLFPCSSGTASIHVAVASMKLKPGSEVIMSPITDMGSVIGILHQQLVPVFADINPRTYNIDPASIRANITEKTGAIMAIHLSGNPCAMDEIMAIGKEHNLIVIEDAAQAWGSRYRGELVGLKGDYGCYSFNDFKHLSCGDGGMVGTNHDHIGAHLAKWGDKCYNRVTNVRNPDELTHNYRMSEPLSAICTAQLGKHDSIVERRVRIGMLLCSLLADTPALLVPEIHPEDTHSFYNIFFRLELDELTVSRDEIYAALQAEGVNAREGGLSHPIYAYDLFQNHNFYAGTWPIRDLGLTTMDYTKVHCPEAEAFIKDSIHMPLNEALTESYIEKVAHAIKTVLARFTK